MKITLITDHKGTIVGAIKGESLSGKKDNVEAGVLLGPGHRTHHVEVDDALAKITDANELHERLAQYAPRA
jgi:hypothetical protein